MWASGNEGLRGVQKCAGGRFLGGGNPGLTLGLGGENQGKYQVEPRRGAGSPKKGVGFEQFWGGFGEF